MYLVGHAAAASCYTTPHLLPPTGNSTPLLFRVTHDDDWLANYQIGFSDGESSSRIPTFIYRAGVLIRRFFAPFCPPPPFHPQKSSSSRISPSLGIKPTHSSAPGRSACRRRATHALGHVSRADVVATRSEELPPAGIHPVGFRGGGGVLGACRPEIIKSLHVRELL